MATSTPSRSGVSPSSSPRLPSPPPFTEVQFGPKSPSVGGSISELQLEAAGQQDDGATRRIRPGTRAVDMARGPPFVQLHQLESPFQLQEYLKSLYHKLTRDEASNTVRPVSKEMAIELATPPIAADTGESVDRNLWLYELCRFLCSKTTRMIVAFFADNPPCSNVTCPEMRASEWQYLCAVHEPPKSCCAIDYCNHTLDWASNILTSTKHFPSRLSLGGEGGNAYHSMRQLTNIFRRVYRIYAHAWFQHREVFWSIETELGLYMFFKTVCDVYELIPEDNYTIPPEAEGEREENLQTPVNTASPERVSVLQRSNDLPVTRSPQPPATTTVTTGATTRRHKHTPSTGVPIAVIAEGAEEDDESASNAANPKRPKSLSPMKKPDLERLNSPKFIDISDDHEADRAPEDPTPVANRDIDPFSLPTSQSEVPKDGNSDTPPAAPGLSGSPSKSAALTDDNETSLTTVSNDNSKAVADPEISDSSTRNKKLQTAADVSTVTEASKGKGDGNDDGEEEGNETMERIEVPSSSIHTATTTTSSEESVASKSDQQLQTGAADGEDKSNSVSEKDSADKKMEE